MTLLQVHQTHQVSPITIMSTNVIIMSTYINSYQFSKYNHSPTTTYMAQSQQVLHLSTVNLKKILIQKIEVTLMPVVKFTDSTIPVLPSEYLLPKNKIKLYIFFFQNCDQCIKTFSKINCLLKVSCQSTCIQSVHCQRWTLSGLFFKQTTVIIVSKHSGEILFQNKIAVSCQNTCSQSEYCQK